jgi:cytidine deaminase
MNNFQIQSKFIEFASLEELPESDQYLIKEAIESSKKAYAPYSKFKVGSALYLANNEIIKGNNQENAAYPSGLCAERIAVFYANALYPDIPIKKLAITALRGEQIVKQPITPCGSCLQVLLETQQRYKTDIEIFLYGTEKIIKAPNLEQFLPMSFNFKSLKG